jgi:copper chaperone CopZ
MAIQTENIGVSGMTCGHCEAAVTKAITQLGKGIINVHVDKTPVTLDQIRQAVNATEIYTTA